MHAPKPTHGILVPALESAAGMRALRDLQWLTRLRWFAIICVTLTAAAAAQLGLLSSPVWPLLVVAGFMAVYNALLDWGFAQGKPQGRALVQQAILGQMLLDILALSLLLHWSGSATNPFAMYFAFHAAIAAMFLPRKTAWMVGGVAFLLHSGTVALESAGWLARYPLNMGLAWPADSLSFSLGYITAFGSMLAGVLYFVQAIALRQQIAEKQRGEHERIALSREKMARVGEVSAGVAHSVRNPLHGLLNCLEILERRKGGDAEVAEILALMREGLVRIEQVTSRLLSLTRDEPPQKRSTDLNALARETCRMVRAGAPKSRIAEALGMPDGVMLELDPHRIGEALMNILDNAVAACGDKGEVSVKTGLAPDGQWGFIEIQDSGSGIAPEVLPKIFDPFFTTKAVGEGTGLGLAIAKRTIEEHGGEIEVTSTVGVGTLVRMTLPLGLAAKQPA